jgi:hypothetical protein
VAYTAQVLVETWWLNQVQNQLGFMVILFPMVALILNGLFFNKVQLHLPLQRAVHGTLQLM